ncbi:MAG TPA: fluoride efflux transporter CrcB [Salinimicrobium sp.]|nr:fluoride efflux transporter CrcB [Salinimicrobium sp.]
MARDFLLVFIGGGLGSAFRFLITKFLNSENLPYGTFAVNVLGSVIMGFILGNLLKENSWHHNLQLLLITGFCGGFTTFSAFAYENFIFLKNGNYNLFLFYSVGTLMLGIAAIFVGVWLSSKF